MSGPRGAVMLVTRAGGWVGGVVEWPRGAVMLVTRAGGWVGGVIEWPKSLKNKA